MRKGSPGDSALTVGFVTSADELPDDMWAAGRPHATRARLTDLERDPRFDTLFALVRCHGDPVLALSAYSPRLSQWTDPAYDVASVLDLAAGADATDFCLLGGRADLRCEALRANGADERLADGAARLAIRAAQDAAAEAGRRCALLYVDDGLLHRAAVSAGVVSSAIVGHRYVIADIGTDLAGYLRQLGASRRSLVRRDLRRLGDTGLQADMCAWADVLDEAVPLIAAVKAGHRQPDLPALIRYRLTRRSADPDVECVAFAIWQDGRLTAVTIGWVYGSVLELYEVGLPGEPAQDRGLRYLEVMFYAPLRYMWSRGLRTLDLALESGHPKTLRGATGHPLAGLVLAAGRSEADSAQERASGG